MSQPPRSRPFILSDADIGALGRAFRAAGFDEAGVSAALGVKGIPHIKDVPGFVAFARTEDGSPLSSLLRLFVLGMPVAPESAAAALQGCSLEALISGGFLAARGGKILAALKVTPVDGLLIGFDRSWEGEVSEVSDHVMGPSDSARLLSGFLIRKRLDAVLDMGSGCGYLAFLAARHHGKVVASDVNPRAAAFVELNARLNGIANVEARTGDLFAPVAGERFDSIFSNPPFVISPEDRLVYLNGGMKADAFCRRLAAEAPAHLKEGGHFQMLCNWVETDGGEWWDHPREWAEGTDCDAWVLRSSTTDPAAYARNWMKVGHDGGPADDPARLEAWLAYYREEKIGSIGAGVVMMRKRAGGGNWFRAFNGPERIINHVGDEAVERMRALDYLARRAAGEGALLDSVLRLTGKARLTQDCHPTEAGWTLDKAVIRLADGLCYAEEIDMYLAGLLAACDGSRTLRQAIDKAAADLGLAAEDVPAETADIVRQLVDEGFLIPPLP